MLTNLTVARLTIELHTPFWHSSKLVIDAAFAEHTITPKGELAIDHRLISARVGSMDVSGLFSIDSDLEPTILNIISDCSDSVLSGTNTRGIYVEAVGGVVSYEILPFTQEVYPCIRTVTIGKHGDYKPTIYYKVYRITGKRKKDKPVHFAIVELVELDRAQCKSEKERKRIVKTMYTNYSEDISIHEEQSKREYEFIQLMEFAIK